MWIEDQNKWEESDLLESFYAKWTAETSDELFGNKEKSLFGDLFNSNAEWRAEVDAKFQTKI